MKNNDFEKQIKKQLETPPSKELDSHILHMIDQEILKSNKKRLSVRNFLKPSRLFMAAAAFAAIIFLVGKERKTDLQNVSGFQGYEELFLDDSFEEWIDFSSSPSLDDEKKPNSLEIYLDEDFEIFLDMVYVNRKETLKQCA